jgi:pilus assembly protein Flp/PilA
MESSTLREPIWGQIKKKMKEIFSGLHINEDGASSVEYAILASLIALIIVSAVGILGVNVRSLFQLVVNNYPAI